MVCEIKENYGLYTKTYLTNGNTNNFETQSS